MLTRRLRYCKTQLWNGTFFTPVIMCNSVMDMTTRKFSLILKQLIEPISVWNKIRNPDVLKRKCQGCRAWTISFFLWSLLEVRSLAHKMNKLGAPMKTLQECFSLRHGFKTTLTPFYSAFRLYGQPETPDREVTLQEEGLKSPSTTDDVILEKECLCSPDVDLLAESFCPCCHLGDHLCYLLMLCATSSVKLLRRYKNHTPIPSRRSLISTTPVSATL